jgi:CheY-like chemotaxis protein
VANVLANSIKYTEPGGRIQIAVRQEGERAVIAIADDGAGISPEMLPRIFDLFHQADRTLDRSQGGLGIGLSIVQRLVEMHGGDVTAQSAGLGHGATFHLRLPTVAAPRARPEMRAEQELAPLRVIVVDDNPDAADSLVRLLNARGHEAVAVYGPRQALSLAGTIEPDVVLLDIGLPEIDGYEVARRMRAAGSSWRLVALTGYGQADDVRRALEAGFDAHLTKPVTLAELEGALRG